MSQSVFERGGYLMRSYSETRWADMMDALHISWLYEPKLVVTSHGAYLPDFYLPRIGMFVEVKGAAPTEIEREKAADVSVTTGCPVVIAFGDMQLMYPGIGGARLMVFRGPHSIQYSTHELHGLIEHGLGQETYRGYLRAGSKRPHPGAQLVSEIMQDLTINRMERSVRERHLAGISREVNAAKSVIHSQMSRCEWGLIRFVEKLNACKEAA